MADRFFDTSAVAKHYRVETGTAAVDALKVAAAEGLTLVNPEAP